MSERIFLGIDVGGTNVKVGLVDEYGKILSQTTAQTPELKTPERVFEFAMHFAMQNTELCGRDNQPLAVGLAVPGVLDSQEFALREVVNLPGWVDRPLLEIMRESTGLPSAVVNDANAAAFAEHEARRLGTQSLALVTLGTGIGCGVVINGRPHGGDHGSAGELGHIAIRFGEDALPCTCGSRGHLETYAGSSGVLARWRNGLKNGQPPVSSCLTGESVSPRDLADAARQGDTHCQQIIDETATYLGQAIGMLGQVIDPAVVLLGGAMTFGGSQSPIGERFLSGVRDSVRETTLVQVGQQVIIEFASLGGQAGTVGAALVGKQAIS